MRALKFFGLLLILLVVPTWTPASGAPPVPPKPRPVATMVPIPLPYPKERASIEPSFFSMTTVRASDYPKLTFGTLAHPEIGAWAWIEKSKGAYDFTLFDRYIAGAVAHGLVDATNTVSVAITLGETPPWAAADPKSCATKAGLTWCTSGPAHLEDWTHFITAMMNHYNGVTQPHVRYYELWNEVNIKLFYTGNQTDLRNLARLAYPIVHADAHSMLLTPSVVGPLNETSPDSAPLWMARYLDAGGYVYADGGAFHGYIAAQTVHSFPMPEVDSAPGCACFGSILTHVTTMRQVFDEHGLRGKPMFDTEGSWGNGTVTDPDTQAAWLARWYLIQAGLRSVDNLQMVAWFTWGDPQTFHWGTIETAAGEPTEAGIAFNQVYAWLANTTVSEPCSSAPDGTWTCAFTRPTGNKELAVWNTQGSKLYRPGPDYTEYRDLAGNTVKITRGQAVTIGAKPILLETSQSEAVGPTPTAVAATPTPAVTLTLGTPRQLLPTSELNMTAVPDMHTAVMQRPDQSYGVYITGRVGARAANDVATWLLTTRDFLTYALGAVSATNASPILDRSCNGANPSCLDNFDADYAGANAVFTAANGKDLLMIYHGETRTFGGRHNMEDRFYAEVGLARSVDNGLIWTRLGPIISGTDPKPPQNPKSAANGIPEPGVIIADDFIYVFYPYFPTAGAPDAGPSTIQVARAPVAGDGAPGTWTKYYNGSFGSQPGLGGLGQPVVPTGSACTGPRQPWVTFSTYLHSYVMVFMCGEGWFFSTSTDLVTWNPPTQFFVSPAPEFTHDEPTDENVILMTPGNPSQMVIGQTGYVLYAHTSAWGRVPHELWLRPFTFTIQ